MIHDLLVRAMLQERERQIRRGRLVAAAERAEQMRKREARIVKLPPTPDRRQSGRKAA